MSKSVVIELVDSASMHVSARLARLKHSAASIGRPHVSELGSAIDSSRAVATASIRRGISRK